MVYRLCQASVLTMSVFISEYRDSQVKCSILVWKVVLSNLKAAISFDHFLIDGLMMPRRDIKQHAGSEIHDI